MRAQMRRMDAAVAVTAGVVLAMAGGRAEAAPLFGQVRGVVHDSGHRPVRGARVTVRAVGSAMERQATTDDAGSFQMVAVPLGEYTVRVEAAGFATREERLLLGSDTSAVLHFQMEPGGVTETVEVEGTAEAGAVTPTTVVGRREIAETPGADRTNSLAMITDYVPGAYMTHDMLHIRGGHQVSWLIDGIPIPNTNIASNVGAQIDPKDIQTVEVQRGSYGADEGDRTYGVFNVVPRSGFERNREAEVVLSAGSFLQTNDQVSVGDHTERFAYYLSANGNRSDYGLAPPVAQVVHDAANGYGGFGSAVYNRRPKEQLRLVGQVREDFFQIPYDPDPTSFGNQQYDSSGLRDSQHERDGLLAGSWVRTMGEATVLQVSPFFHSNRARYEPGAGDTPVATTADRSSLYAGGQVSVTTAVARNTVEAGLFSFGQHDSTVFGVAFPEGSGGTTFRIAQGAAGGVVEEWLSDQWRATGWLTLTAGLRQTHFEGGGGDGGVTENATSPRFGAAVRVPKLGWTFRGFYGRFYQPPPLQTVSGPVIEYAGANNAAFAPLKGERDEEHQFGVQIPVRGWVLDVDTFKTRANNFLDHANVGESSLYFPVTVDGALIRAWEATVRSPRLGRWGQAHLAYSNQIAEQRGNLTGGLVCVPVGDPACDAGWGYTPVDHDQRNTLSVGFAATLPWRTTASANVNYGSGFVNGDPDPKTPYPNAYLPAHTTVDLQVGKSFGERVTATVNALNVGDRRVLLDNSLTFGGFHFNDPREVYGEVRWRWRY